MKKRRLQKKYENLLVINWRTTWYSVVIWIMGIAISGFVVMPWFYLVLPLTIFWLTVFYFNNSVVGMSKSKKRIHRDMILKAGLGVSLFWFGAIVALDILEIVGPYYANVFLYFSDARNYIKYPLILLAPFIYTIILDNVSNKQERPKISKLPDKLGLGLLPKQ